MARVGSTIKTTDSDNICFCHSTSASCVSKREDINEYTGIGVKTLDVFMCMRLLPIGAAEPLNARLGSTSNSCLGKIAMTG